MALWEPFRSLVFHVKPSYTQDSDVIATEGGELRSTLEPDIRVVISRRTFDGRTKVKLRVREQVIICGRGWRAAKSEY